ncbi:hypothetical protein MAF45_10855, partial [Mesosutterella sp. OilRF-GAM-744-9]
SSLARVFLGRPCKSPSQACSLMESGMDMVLGSFVSKKPIPLHFIRQKKTPEINCFPNSHLTDQEKG